MDWSWGGVWGVDATAGVLHFLAHAGRTPAAEAFAQTSRSLTLETGTGLPGQAWQRVDMVSSEETRADVSYPRWEFARAVGFQHGFALPVVAGGEVAFVVEFFSTAIDPPDDELRAVFRAIAQQIGTFVEHMRAIADLRENESRSRSILTTSLDAIVMMDHVGRITEFNPSAEAMFGHSRANVIGRDVADTLVPPHFRERHRVGLERYLGNGEGALIGKRVELSALHADGTEFPVEITVSPILTGGPPNFTAFIRDISQRRRREAQERFLSDVGEFLAASLDFETTLTSVARMAVPFFADWCIVDLIDADGNPLRLDAAHADPDLEPVLQAMLRDYPPRPDSPHPATQVARTGAAVLLPDVPQEFWEAIAHDQRHLHMLRALQPRSGLTVPLVARSRILGALEFVRSTPGWRFDESDHQLGEEVARRAAMAVDNANLHRTTREALTQAEESLALLETVLATAPVGLAFWDRDLRFVRVNQFLAEMNGRPVAEHLGKRLREVLPTAAARLEPLFAQIVGSGEPVLNVDISGETHSEPGRHRHWLASYYPVQTHDGTVIGIGGVVAEVTEQRQAEDRLRFLAEASQIVSRSLDYEATLQSVARLAVPFLAHWCIVYLLEDDGTIRRIAIEHANVAEVHFAAHLREPVDLDPDADTGVPQVIRSGQPLLYPEVTAEQLVADARDPAQLLDLTRALHLRSWICVPLTVHGRTIGAISFMTNADGKQYDTSDLALAKEIANRAAVAVENARLFRAEQETRRYAERIADLATRLQSVTAGLSGALTRDEVAEVIVNLGVSALGAQRGMVALLVDNGTQVEIVRAVGYPAAMQATWRRFAVSEVTPPSEVIRSGAPMFLGSFGEREARFPHLVRERTSLGGGAVAALPLILGTRTLGALALGFAEDRRFDRDDRAFLQALAQQCAQALDRARLYEEEQQHHATAEAAREQAARQAARLRVLAEASHAFAEASLDLPQLVATLARQVSEVLGDYCGVHLIDEDGITLTPAASHHADPAALELAQHILAGRPLRMGEPLPTQVFAANGPVVLVDPTRATFHRLLPSEHRAYIDRLRVHSVMAIALRVRGRDAGMLVMARDRTHEPYSSEDETLFRDLADRATLALENARLYKDAQQAVRSREQFLSIASHELRTPLTTIKASAQLLDRWFRLPDADPERLQRLSGQLRGEIDRLEILVSDLLDASRIQQERLDLRPEPFDLTDLARVVVSRFEHAPERTAAHDLVVDAPEPVTGEWDPARIDQVLTNLISNALKYSPDGGNVRVRVRRDGSKAFVAVSDQGIGLSESERAQLFQPFARGDAARQHFGGTGLGLFISAQIVERHGGSLTVESAPGQGSTFTMRLPVTSLCQ
jgi:PAS domain S-box-containing protein